MPGTLHERAGRPLELSYGILDVVAVDAIAIDLAKELAIVTHVSGPDMKSLAPQQRFEPRFTARY